MKEAYERNKEETTMPSNDINVHLCPGLHTWFPKVVENMTSINFHAPKRRSCDCTGLPEFYESAAFGT